MEIKDMLDPHVTLALDGKAIKALRHRAKLTQRELAEAMGVIPRTIRHWEANDRHPRELEQIRRLLRLLAPERLNPDPRFERLTHYDDDNRTISWGPFDKAQTVTWAADGTPIIGPIGWSPHDGLTAL